MQTSFITFTTVERHKRESKMKLFVLLVLTFGCVQMIYAQDHATAIVGSVFEGVGNILKTIGIGPQPQQTSTNNQSQGPSLNGLIELVMKLFTGLLQGGSKPSIAPSIPAFPKDNTPTFPGGSGSFPTSSGSSSGSSSASTAAPSSDLSDFPGVDDFLNS